MLESVDVGRQSIGDYEASAGREAVERLLSLAEPLRGARVLGMPREKLLEAEEAAALDGRGPAEEVIF